MRPFATVATVGHRVEPTLGPIHFSVDDATDITYVQRSHSSKTLGMPEFTMSNIAAETSRLIPYLGHHRLTSEKPAQGH
jgi:hypothetical protein